MLYFWKCLKNIYFGNAYFKSCIFGKSCCPMAFPTTANVGLSMQVIVHMIEFIFGFRLSWRYLCCTTITGWVWSQSIDFLWCCDLSSFFFYWIFWKWSLVEGDTKSCVYFYNIWRFLILFSSVWEVYYNYTASDMYGRPTKYIPLKLICIPAS